MSNYPGAGMAACRSGYLAVCLLVSVTRDHQCEK